MPRKDLTQRNAYYAEWREKNREKIRKRSKEWSDTHHEQRRAYYKSHSAGIVAKTKAWRIANPEKTQESRRRYRHKHHDGRIKYQRERRRKNPRSQRDHHLWHVFGMKLEDYEEILKTQNGLCAICNKPERRKFNGKIRPLAVDHNDKTGEVRELLCSSCNTAIGLLGHDIDRIIRAAVYLSVWT